MKKYFFALLLLIISVGLNAQIVDVYHNGVLEKTYMNSANDDYKVVFRGHDYVEIGGVKWATMNIGATTVAESPETSFGDFYLWGEIDTYYQSVTYDQTGRQIFTFGKNSTLTHIPGVKTGHNADNYYGSNKDQEWNPVPYDDNLVLKPEYDVARIKWGGTWRMPTSDDYQKLLDACGVSVYNPYPTNVPSQIRFGGAYWVSPNTTVDDKTYKVGGLLFVSRADISKRLFFPSSGYANSVGLWTANRSPENTSLANYISANKQQFQLNNSSYFNRAMFPCPIRPVSD